MKNSWTPLSCLLDLLTSNATLPANFTNNGTVVLNTERRILTARRLNTSFTATAMGHAGHTYQLQSSPTLGGPWANVGSVVHGSGAMLSFTDAAANARAKFYRLRVGP
jgi:hypothetical protein